MRNTEANADQLMAEIRRVTDEIHRVTNLALAERDFHKQMKLVEKQCALIEIQTDLCRRHREFYDEISKNRERILHMLELESHSCPEELAADALVYSSAKETTQAGDIFYPVRSGKRYKYPRCKVKMQGGQRSAMMDEYYWNWN